MKIRPVIHHKTGNVYLIINEHLINATNSADGQRMVLYMNLDGETFSRESLEFWVKFGAIDKSDVVHFDRRTKSISKDFGWCHE